jgi:hypothetical protein
MTKEEMNALLDRQIRRADKARAQGGIWHEDFVPDGIPLNWELDEITHYWVPSVAALDAVDRLN